MQFPSQPTYPTLTLVRMLPSGNTQLSKAFESKVQTPANKAYHDPVKVYIYKLERNFADLLP